jgi:hypothetical protein
MKKERILFMILFFTIILTTQGIIAQIISDCETINENLEKGSCNLFEKNSLIFYEKFDSINSINSNGGQYKKINIVSGFLGNSSKFNNSELLNYSIPNFSEKEGTLSFWVNPNYNLSDGPSKMHTFVYFKNNTSGNYFAISDGWWSMDGFYFRYYPVTADFSGSNSLSYNNWSFVTVVWRSYGTVKGRWIGLYINGVPYDLLGENYSRKYFPDWIPFEKSSNRVYIGSIDSGNNNAESLIDEVRIYNKTMNSSEVDELYKSYFITNSENHRYEEWKTYMNLTPYIPKRNSQGIIMENRIMLDEGSSFITNSTEVIRMLNESKMNVFVPCIWHGRGVKWNSSLEEVDSQLVSYHLNEKDYFKEFIEKAHSAGIEVHPWFCVSLNIWDKHNEWSSSGTPTQFYDIHNPDFRKYIVDLMIEVVQKYDIDGVNLDYIRSGGICNSSYCIEDYFNKTGRNLTIDIVSNLSKVYEWEGKDVELIVKDFHDRAKKIKPDLVISVDGGDRDELYSDFTRKNSSEGRNSLFWIEKGLVDIVFGMDYSIRINTDYFDYIKQKIISEPKRFTRLIGNYNSIDLSVSPRAPKDLRFLVEFLQFKYPNTIPIYYYGGFNDLQAIELANRPFNESAVTDWSFVGNCNNGFCEIGETCSSCVADCGSCSIVNKTTVQNLISEFKKFKSGSLTLTDYINRLKSWIFE